jgi:uncharacterized Tic20 family protein
MSLPVPPQMPPSALPPAPPYAANAQPFYPGTPTKDECTMAMLAHLLQVFSSFVGPLIIFVVKQDSRFVKYHAVQCLIWQAAYMLIGFGAMAVFFFGVIGSAMHAPHGQPGQPPPPVFFLFPLIWLFWMGGWVVNLVLGIIYAIKANQGEWAGYPIIGRLLLREYNPAALSHPTAPQI